MELLIQKGVGVNDVDDDGQTALMRAAAKGKVSRLIRYCFFIILKLDLMSSFRHICMDGTIRSTSRSFSRKII